LANTTVTEGCAVSVKSAVDARSADRARKSCSNAKQNVRKSESSNNFVGCSSRTVQSVSKAEQACFRNADPLPFQHVDTDSIVGSEVVCPSKTSLKRSETSKRQEIHDTSNLETGKNGSHNFTCGYLKPNKREHYPGKSTSCRRIDQGHDQQMPNESFNTDQGRPLFVTGHQRRQSHKTAEQHLENCVSVLDESHSSDQAFSSEQLWKKQIHNKDDCCKTTLALHDMNGKQRTSNDIDVIKTSSKQHLCDRVMKHLPRREISSNVKSRTRMRRTGEQVSSLSISGNYQTNHSTSKNKRCAVKQQHTISEDLSIKLKVTDRSQCQDLQFHAAKSSRPCHVQDVQLPLPQEKSSANNSLKKKTQSSKGKQVQRSHIDGRVYNAKNAMEKQSRLELYNCEPMVNDTLASKSKDVSGFRCKSYAIQSIPVRRPSLDFEENWELNLLECFTINEKSPTMPHMMKDVNCVDVNLESIKASSGIMQFLSDGTSLSVSCDANTAESKHMSYRPPTPTDSEFKYKCETPEEHKQLTEELIAPVKYSYMEDRVDGDIVKVELNVTEELVSNNNCILSDDQFATAVNDGQLINFVDNRMNLQCVDSGADVNDLQNYTDSTKMSPFKRLKAGNQSLYYIKHYLVSL